MPSLPILLEDLPDELILLIVSFIRSSDVYRCLFDQNDRFRRIVCDYQSLRVDLASDDDIQIDHIRNLHRCLQPDRILYLSLSNRIVFSQIRIFTRFIRRWDQFKQLRFLSLHRPTVMDARRLINALQHLSHLHTLKIDRIREDDVELLKTQRGTYERVLSDTLPALRRVTLQISYKMFYSDWYIRMNPVNHLEHLTIATIAANIIYILLDNLPHLKSLSMTTSDVGDSNTISSSKKVYSNVRFFSLKAETLYSSRQLEHLFQYALVGLVHLSLCINSFLTNELDGFHWCQLLQPLIQLKRFNCYFRKTLSYSWQPRNNYIESLFNSYNTSFWLVEYQWPMHIIHCDSNITICSIPYHFSHLSIANNNNTKSMITGESLISRPYRHVTSLVLSTRTPSRLISRTVPYFHFDQIETVIVYEYASIDRSLSCLIPIERVRILKLITVLPEPNRKEVLFNSFFIKAHALCTLHLFLHDIEHLINSFIHHKPTCQWLSEHIHHLVLESSRHRSLLIDEFTMVSRAFVGFRSCQCHVKLLDEVYALAECAFNNMPFLFALSVYVEYKKLQYNYGPRRPLQTIKHLSQGDRGRLKEFLQDRTRRRQAGHFNVHCESNQVGIWL